MESGGPGQNTDDVGERHKFDEGALENYLKREVPSFQGGLMVKKFNFGQSNPTYLLTDAGGTKYVLRKKPPGKVIKGAHAVDREYRVMKALGAKGYEAPKMLAFCDHGEVIGIPFYVMQFVEGRIVDNGLSSLPAAQRKPAMLSILRCLAKLHAYDPAALGLTNVEHPYGKVGGFYSRQIATMSRTSDMQAGKVEPLRSMKSLLALFEANMPEDRSCVVHGDWKADNVILSEDGSPRVLAVLDWELSTIGHPMSDLANLCLPFHLGPLGPLMSYPPFADDCYTEDEVHKVYCEAADVPFPIAHWSFFVSFSCFRLAVIAQGVAMRAAMGTASQADASQAKVIVATANALCDHAHSMMSAASGASAKL